MVIREHSMECILPSRHTEVGTVSLPASSQYAITLSLTITSSLNP